MSKINKKIALFISTFVLLLSLIFSINIFTAKAQIINELPDFKMENGASVYLKDVNGIRFTSTVSTDKLNEVKANNEVSFGTFILPLSYAEKNVPNELNCFGDKPVYVWGTAEPSANQLKILHTESNVTEIEGKNITEIKAAVVNMLDNNLDRDYMGYAYAKITDKTTQNVKYQFATQELSNSRSILEIAGKAYNDANTPEADKVKLLEYKTRYAKLNGGKAEFNYKVHYIVDGVLDESVTETKTAEIWTDLTVKAEDFAAPESYVFLDYLKSDSIKHYTKDDVVTVNCTGLTKTEVSGMEINANSQVGNLSGLKYEQRIVDGTKIWIDSGTNCMLMWGKDGVYVCDGIANTYVAAKYQIGDNDKFHIWAKGNDRGGNAYSNSNLRVRIVDIETKKVYTSIDWTVTSGKIGFELFEGVVDPALINKEVIVLIEDDSCYDGSKGDNYAADTMWVYGIEFYKQKA